MKAILSAAFIAASCCEVIACDFTRYKLDIQYCMTYQGNDRNQLYGRTSIRKAVGMRDLNAFLQAFKECQQGHRDDDNIIRNSRECEDERPNFGWNHALQFCDGRCVAPEPGR
jgi:hypothetical protein